MEYEYRVLTKLSNRSGMQQNEIEHLIQMDILGSERWKLVGIHGDDFYFIREKLMGHDSTPAHDTSWLSRDN